MAVDPLDNPSKLDENNLPIHKKEALDRLKLSGEQDRRFGVSGSRTHSVADLGLDRLSKYEDYIDLDKTNLLRQDVNKMRAENQSGTAQAFNGIVGGIASGLATAVEDVSYIVDFDNHIKWLNGQDTWEKNWLAKAMGQVKEGIDEAMPIYRPNNETFDWGDSGFYWSSVKGILDSAVGFGLPGGAIAKGVGAGLKGIGSGLKAMRIAKLSEVMAAAGDAGFNAATALGAGAIQNYAEGKIMGIETYENTYESLIKQGVEESKARQLAGQAADEMLLNNRAMMLSDAFSLYGLAKGLKGAQRNILNAPGFRNRVKEFGKNIISPNADNIVLQGAKEAGEEIVQNVIQMEAQYGAEQDAGLDSDLPENTLDRLLGFATSDQALLEGMMGFLGGGPQRILSEVTSGKLNKTAREEYKKRHADQQETMASNAEYVKNSANNTNEKIALINEAMSKDDIKTAEAAEISINDGMIISNIEMGTLGNLEESTREMLSNPEITEEGKKSLTNLLDRIGKIEKVYNRYGSRSNIASILSNRSQYDIAKTYREGILNKIQDTTNELQDIVDTSITPGYKPVQKGVKGEFITTPFTYNLESLDTNPYDKTADNTAFNQYNNFIGRIKKEPAFARLQKYKDTLKKSDKKLETLQEEFNKSLTKEGEQKHRAKLHKAAVESVVNTQVREATTPVKSEGDSPVVGKLYEDANGSIKKLMGITKDGRYIVGDLSAKSGVALSPEEFVKQFAPEGVLTSREDKQDVENAAKEVAKQEQASSVKEDPIKTKKDEIVASATQVFNKDVVDVEPSNTPDSKHDDKTKESNRSSNPLSLAWFSFNSQGDKAKGFKSYEEKHGTLGESPKTAEEQERDEQLATILEDPDNLFTNQEVSITIEDLDIEQYSKLKTDTEKEAYISNIVDNGKIKVTFDNVQGFSFLTFPIEMYMHLPSFNKSEGYATTMAKTRRSIIENILSSPTNTIYSKITSKGPGSVQRTENNVELKAALQEQNNNNFTFLVRSNDGNLYTGYDETNKKFTYDPDLGLSKNPEASPGAIFVKIPTANGTYFPLRVQVSNLKEEEANLIYEIYNGIWDSKNPLANKTLLIDSGLDLTSPLIASLIKTLPNKEESSVIDLLNALVYEGASSKEKMFPLLREKNMMIYGKNKVSMSNLANNTDGARDNFINWLTTKKIRNINYKNFNNPEYKNHLLNNELLTTNSLSGPKGIIFAQPTFQISSDYSNSKGTVVETIDLKDKAIPDKMIVDSPAQQDKIESQKADIERRTIQMQPDNVAKILAGTKTTTTRSESQAKQINIPVGETAIVNIGGKDFLVTNRGLLTIKEAGSREAIEKSEDFENNTPKYQQTKEWLNGKGKLYVYDITKYDAELVTLEKEQSPKEVIKDDTGQPIKASTSASEIKEALKKKEENEKINSKVEAYLSDVKNSTLGVFLSKERIDEFIQSVNKFKPLVGEEAAMKKAKALLINTLKSNC